MSSDAASTYDFADISLMSAPAAKAFSDPVMTIARTLSFISASRMAVTSSPSNSEFSALRASGLLSLTRET